MRRREKNSSSISSKNTNNNSKNNSYNFTPVCCSAKQRSVADEMCVNNKSKNDSNNYKKSAYSSNKFNSNMERKHTTYPKQVYVSIKEQVKNLKINATTLLLLFLLLLLPCIIGVLYCYEMQTFTHIFEQTNLLITKNSNYSTYKDNNTDYYQDRESYLSSRQISLPFIPLHERALRYLEEQKYVNKSDYTNTSSMLFDELDVISFALPPTLQRELSQAKLESFLRLGTRVAGTERKAHLHFLLHDALKNLRTISYKEKTSKQHIHNFETSTSLYNYTSSSSELWSVEWDNFTENGPTTFDVEHINHESTLTNPISFKNIIFTFNGGKHYQELHYCNKEISQQQEEQEQEEEEYLNKMKNIDDLHNNSNSDDVDSTNRSTIVLAAHWDSKLEPIGLLGACDSAVPVLMLTRLMQNIAVLTEMSASLHRTAEQHNLSFDEYYLCTFDNVNNMNAINITECNTEESENRLLHALKTLLTPVQYHYMVEYYFAGTSNNKKANDNDNNTATLEMKKSNALFQHTLLNVIDWIKWIDSLPPISVILFDGEEAFVDWQGQDNTYGSRHLAARWQRESLEPHKTSHRNICNKLTDKTDHVRDANWIKENTLEFDSERRAANNITRSKYDSIALFALLDLLGTHGTEMHNFFPTFTGTFYKELAETEQQHRIAALHESVVMSREFARINRQNSKHCRNNNMNNYSYGGNSDESGKQTHRYSSRFAKEILKHYPIKNVPLLWHKYGAPNEMFSLFDFKQSEMKWLALERNKYKLQRELENKISNIKTTTKRQINSKLASSSSLSSSSSSSLSKLLLEVAFEHTYDILHTVQTPLTTSAQWKMLQELNKNVFFSMEEAALSKWGGQDSHYTGIEDDHKHWLSTKRVLHLIAAPFPREWHTLADNGTNIDHGTVVDVNRILWQFVLNIGKQNM